MPRWLRRVLVITAFSILGLILGTVAAWGLDKFVHVDQVNRNVTLDGIPVGGMSEPELDAVIDRLAVETSDDLVTISAPGLEMTLTYAEAGISPDRAAIREAVFGAGRQSNPVSSFATWVTAIGDPVDVDPVFTVDVATAAAAIESYPGHVEVAPVEPDFLSGER